MVEYSPPPPDLSHLNFVQRYMQKGELDTQDYAYLLVFVLAYFVARPTITRGIKWLLADEALKEGERAQAEFQHSKAKVGPNTIRDTVDTDATAIPATSGDLTTGSSVDTKGKVTNRKAKDNTVTDALLDWDDQPERKPTPGDKEDVVAWMNRWSNEE